MRVVHLSTFDSRGGACRSAQRLHEGLLAIGADSHMLVATKVGGAPNTHQLRGKLARSCFWAGAKAAAAWMRYKPGPKSAFFSLDLMPDAVASELAVLKPDLINLHWINFGFLRLETVARLSRPVVWTCHDMWPMTGGCHYSGDCRNYETVCGCCPQLGSIHPRDMARRVWARKRGAWSGAIAQIITPSRWLAGCARASSLFREVPVSVIPYGLNTDVFRPLDQTVARRILGLPADGKLVLFGADSGAGDPRKGFDLLVQALHRLSPEARRDTGLVMFGGAGSTDLAGLAARVYPLGSINDDDRLACAYSAADVFVAPSREDNLPNTVLEALACGTPCLAFDIGGMPDLIEPMQTGYLAVPFAPEELAAGLAWLLENTDPAMRERCRRRILARHTLINQAKHYQTLYAQLTAEANR